MPKRTGEVSSNYRIFETKEFQKTISKLVTPHLKFIKEKLTSYVCPQLRQQPYYGSNIKKIRDYQPPTWRYRVGHYRVFYLINESEQVVYMLNIENRKDAYR